MGCGHGEKLNLLNKNPKNESLFEPYEEINPYTFNISMYNLSWKKKPDICYFQIVTEEECSKCRYLNILTDVNDEYIYRCELATEYRTNTLKNLIKQVHENYKIKRWW